MVGHGLHPPAGDVPRQRLAPHDAQRAQRDDVGIAEQIVEKWLNSGGGGRPAPFEQHHTHSLSVTHSRSSSPPGHKNKPKRRTETARRPHSFSARRAADVPTAPGPFF